MMPAKHVSEDTRLNIDLQTDEIINANIKFLGLKEVTSPIPFERGAVPTIDGLFSEVIFGVTQEERRKTWGYINLGTKVFHPYVYEVLTSVQQNIASVCRGEKSWKVTDKHDLVEVKENDPDYDENNTGMDWMVANYPKIVFKKNKSRERSEKIDMLNTLKPEEAIITKWLVIPVFFRDIESKDGPLKIPPINNEYRNLIRFAQSVKFESISMMSNMAKFNMQQTLVNIRKYYQEIVEKSDGFFKQYVVGKNPDYGVRSVISCPVLTQYDKPDDMPIDMNHTGFPLSEVLQALFPYVKRWVYNWALNTFESKGGTIPFWDTNSKKMIVARAIDPMSKFTPDYIKKKIDSWIDNYESRCDYVEVDLELENGNTGKRPLYFSGIPYAGDPTNENASGIVSRPLTWTDLLYMAAEECASDKYAWVTRYPLISYLGTFPTKIFVLSTVETVPMKIIVNGEERLYKYYPKIDVNATSMEVSISFNETVNMANSMLDTIGGDYDGDTVSAKAIYSVEANQEIIDIINSPQHFLNCEGKLIASMTNEGTFTLFNMTKD